MHEEGEIRMQHAESQGEEYVGAIFEASEEQDQSFVCIK